MTNAKQDMFDKVHETFPDKAVEVEEPVTAVTTAVDTIGDEVDTDDMENQELMKKYPPVPAEYDLEVFLSTDGKHTVHGKAHTTEGKKRMIVAVQGTYDEIVSRYGTKQHQNVEAYKGIKTGAGGATSYPKVEKVYVEGRVCPLDQGKLVTSVTKTGKTVVKCENGRYDFMTKTVIGCQHTEWI